MNFAVRRVLSPALPMSRAMRLRRVGWEALGRLQAGPTRPLVDRALKPLCAGRGWASFIPSAVTADAFTLDVAGADPAIWVETAAVLLQRHGVVVLHGLFPADLVAAAAADAEALLEPFEQAFHAGGPDNGELLGCIWQSTANPLVDGQTSKTPVVSLRPRGPAPEAGQIGATLIERVARERGLNGLGSFLAAPERAHMDATAGRVFAYNRRVTDLLKKASVTATQSAHIDTLCNFYYGFVYLNDISDTDAGPYAYLPGSHRREDLLFRDTLLNRIAGRTERDLPTLNDHVLPLTGPAGTVVLSCQRGVHRGLPQARGRLRLALQVSYL